jgi:hypothetical protein
LNIREGFDQKAGEREDCRISDWEVREVLREGQLFNSRRITLTTAEAVETFAHTNPRDMGGLTSSKKEKDNL